MADNYALLQKMSELSWNAYCHWIDCQHQKASELSWNAFCHWIDCQQMMFLVASRPGNEMNMAAFDWQNKELTDSVEQSITFPVLHLQNADGQLSVLCQDTSYVKNSKRCKVKDLDGPFPRACLMHRMIGEILDDSQQQRDQYTKLVQRLWIGDYGTGMIRACTNKGNSMIQTRLWNACS